MMMGRRLAEVPNTDAAIGQPKVDHSEHRFTRHLLGTGSLRGGILKVKLKLEILARH